MLSGEVNEGEDPTGEDSSDENSTDEEEDPGLGGRVGMERKHPKRRKMIRGPSSSQAVPGGEGNEEGDTTGKDSSDEEADMDLRERGLKERRPPKQRGKVRK